MPGIDVLTLKNRYKFCILKIFHREKISGEKYACKDGEIKFITDDKKNT